MKDGQKYSYKIQSVLLLDGNIVSGNISKEVSAVPVDLTPPTPPLNISVAAVDGGNKIYWEKSTADDVAGYRVYRRSAEQQRGVMIGSTDAATVTFTDSNVPQNVRVYYSITTVDKAQPPNESELSREVTLRR